MQNDINVYSRSDKSLFFQLDDEPVPDGFIYFYSARGAVSALMLATAITLTEQGMLMSHPEAKDFVDSKLFNKEEITVEVRKAMQLYSLMRMCGTEAMDD